MNKHEEYQEALDFYWKVYEEHHLGMLARHYIDMLKELVDKETPKKVCHTIAPHPTIEYDQEFDYFYCPNCGEWVNEKCMDNYCSICGQKLDWSDEDDK